MSYKPQNLQIKINTDVSGEPVTLAEFKNFAKIDDTMTTDDILILSLLVAARTACERYTNLSFAEKNIFVWLDNYGWSVRLPYGPLLAINDIYEIDSDGTETALDATDYYIKNELIVFTGLPVLPLKFDVQMGYDTISSGDAGQSLPVALKNAIMVEALYRYENRNDMSELSDNTKLILKPYMMII